MGNFLFIYQYEGHLDFWKLEFNDYLMVYFLSKKDFKSMRMLIMSKGLYTGKNFKQIIRKKK